MDKYSFLNAVHPSYLADLYDKYLQNPNSIEPSWKAFFQGFDFGNEGYNLNGEIVDAVTTQIPEHVQKEFQVCVQTFSCNKRLVFDVLDFGSLGWLRFVQAWTSVLEKNAGNGIRTRVSAARGRNT